MTSHPEYILSWSWSTSLNSILNSDEFELHVLTHRTIYSSYANAKRYAHMRSLQRWKNGGESFLERGDFVDWSQPFDVIRFTTSTETVSETCSGQWRLPAKDVWGQKRSVGYSHRCRTDWSRYPWRLPRGVIGSTQRRSIKVVALVSWNQASVIL